MGTLLSVIEGVVGIVGSFIGAMNSTQLNAFLSVVGRWMSRIELFLWPDVLDSKPPADRKRRGRGRSAR